jgi:hypothetical protein
MMVFRIIVVVVFALSLGVPAMTQQGNDTDGFNAALSAYFKVSVVEVDAVRSTGLAGDDLAVAFKTAVLIKKTSPDVAKMRVRGDSWSDIAKVRNIDASSFYMIIGGEFESKTFTPIFDKYRLTPQSQWKNLVLTDDDIINLVNLKFISSYYDYSAFEVMKMRDNGFSYPDISTKVCAAKEEMENEQKKKQREAARKEADSETS